MSTAAQEIPLVFDCQGSELIGMLHLPQAHAGRGMLSIVAGGPQYRGGVCRMQINMARELASAGVPVMRFDYRGLGDSEGDFRGFRDVGPDLAAAVAAFQAHVPQLREVVLWGGCDAASAILINAWKLPAVTSLVLGNPWVHSTETSDGVAVQHYSQRIRDKDFWLKLLRLQYNPLPALATLVRRAATKLRPGWGSGSGAGATAAAGTDDVQANFVGRMRKGMAGFGGEVLMLMSGRSLLSREFDQLVSERPAWQQAMAAPRRVVRHVLPDADQAFSTLDARREVTALTLRWMQAPDQLHSHDPVAQP
jgi:exosortase A-associated hydrolase 1